MMKASSTSRRNVATSNTTSRVINYHFPYSLSTVVIMFVSSINGLVRGLVDSLFKAYRQAPHLEFDFGRVLHLELRQKPLILTPEEPDVRDAEPDHGEALQAQAKGVANLVPGTGWSSPVGQTKQHRDENKHQVNSAPEERGPPRVGKQ